MQIYESNGTTSHDLDKGTSYKSGSNWVTNSSWPTTVTQWGGQVASASEGVTAPSLPLPDAAASDPIYLLKDQSNSGSMASKAAVIITDGVAKDAAGKHSMPGAASLPPPALYDYREGKYARRGTYDMAAFQAQHGGAISGKRHAVARRHVGRALRHVTVAAPTGKFSAVRLKNGATLSSPLTVATDNPIYVQGDYNKTSPQAAAILSELDTILWAIGRTAPTPQARVCRAGQPRTRCSTWTSCRAIRRPARPDTGEGSNFLRYLENWTGDTFTLTGSLVCMWASTKTTGSWQNTGV